MVKKLGTSTHPNTHPFCLKFCDIFRATHSTYIFFVPKIKSYFYHHFHGLNSLKLAALLSRSFPRTETGGAEAGGADGGGGGNTCDIEGGIKGGKEGPAGQEWWSKIPEKTKTFHENTGNFLCDTHFAIEKMWNSQAHRFRFLWRRLWSLTAPWEAMSGQNTNTFLWTFALLCANQKEGKSLKFYFSESF